MNELKINIFNFSKKGLINEKTTLVKFHPKNTGWFVSDVISHDFYFVLNFLSTNLKSSIAKELGQKWASNLREGRWTLKVILKGKLNLILIKTSNSIISLILLPLFILKKKKIDSLFLDNTFRISANGKRIRALV